MNTDKKLCVGLVIFFVILIVLIFVIDNFVFKLP